MDLEEIEAYIRSRVGAVFSTEHAEKIISMVRHHIQEETAAADRMASGD